MATLPRSSVDPYTHRIQQVVDDGYVQVVTPTAFRPYWALTERGWKVLAACADRPAKKPPQKVRIKGD